MCVKYRDLFFVTLHCFTKLMIFCRSLVLRQKARRQFIRHVAVNFFSSEAAEETQIGDAVFIYIHL